MQIYKLLTNLTRNSKNNYYICNAIQPHKLKTCGIYAPLYKLTEYLSNTYRAIFDFA